MYVYILESKKYNDKIYIGITHDLRKRLPIHNRGEVPSTAQYRPWKIIVAIWLHNKDKAFILEKYLKTGSGRAFTKKHFL